MNKRWVLYRNTETRLTNLFLSVSKKRKISYAAAIEDFFTSMGDPNSQDVHIPYGLPYKNKTFFKWLQAHEISSCFMYRPFFVGVMHVDHNSVKIEIKYRIKSVNLSQQFLNTKIDVLVDKISEVKLFDPIYIRKNTNGNYTEIHYSLTIPVIDSVRDTIKSSEYSKRKPYTASILLQEITKLCKIRNKIIDRKINALNKKHKEIKAKADAIALEMDKLDKTKILKYT